MELEALKKIYAGYSGIYDALFKRFFYPRIRHAISTMNIDTGEKVLDVGVGTGLSLSLYPSGCDVVGIDLSSAMLRKAKEKVKKEGLSHIELLEMDAMSLKFADNSFDKVFISHVVSVVPDPHRVMSEVRRVCKDRGKVVIVNHFKSRNKIVARFEKIIDPISRKIGWRSDFCVDEFISLSGLKIDKILKLKKVDFWQLIFATNFKDEQDSPIPKGRA
ncbi:MAG: methyltransferase domain-containing protein [Deltaproteobacteria bacterium]|nr:methyltransferase domain-containing protein [Deltaproteobacteria bacterium]